MLKTSDILNRNSLTQKPVGLSMKQYTNIIQLMESEDTRQPIIECLHAMQEDNYDPSNKKKLLKMICETSDKGTMIFITNIIIRNFYELNVYEIMQYFERLVTLLHHNIEDYKQLEETIKTIRTKLIYTQSKNTSMTSNKDNINNFFEEIFIMIQTNNNNKIKK